MKVNLIFKAPFSGWFGKKEHTLEIAQDSTVGEAIDVLVKTPEFKRALEDKGGTSGELKALFLINSSFVDKDYVLKNKEELKIVGFFSGG